jgi:hypothetical protein
MPPVCVGAALEAMDEDPGAFAGQHPGEAGAGHAMAKLLACSTRGARSATADWLIPGRYSAWSSASSEPRLC